MKQPLPFPAPAIKVQAMPLISDLQTKPTMLFCCSSTIGGSPQFTDDLAADQESLPLVPAGRDRADDPAALRFTEDVVRSDLLANLQDRRTRVPVVGAST